MELSFARALSTMVHVIVCGRFHNVLEVNHRRHILLTVCDYVHRAVKAPISKEGFFL